MAFPGEPKTGGMASSASASSGTDADVDETWRRQRNVWTTEVRERLCGAREGRGARGEFVTQMHR